MVREAGVGVESMKQVDMQDRAAREEIVGRFFAGTGPSYDRVVAVTTLGRDGYWKRRLLAHVPADARSILDLACGTGIVSRQLHEQAPQARIVGVDFTEEYLEVAREKFADTDADVTFLRSNAETVELEGEFDVVVSSYIPKYVDANALLDNIDEHVAPGGIVALHDFDYPHGMLARIAWRLHMGLVRRLGRRVFEGWDECFDRNLAALIRDSHWVKEYVNAFERHGYEAVRHEKLTFRMAGIVSARKPG